MTDGSVPSFMSHLPDDTGKSTLDPLKEDILSDETPTQTPTEEKPKEETKQDEPAGGEKPKEETKSKEEETPKEEKPTEDIVYDAAEILAKKLEDRTPEEIKALEEEGEGVLTDEQKEQLVNEKKEAEAKKVIVDILTKKPAERTDEEKKTLSEATNLTDDQKKQLEDEGEAEKPKVDLTKVAERAAEEIANANKVPEKEQTELQKAVIMAGRYPLAFPEVPKKEDFLSTDKDGNETFDIEGWGKAFANNVVMSLQKSLTGGPLSAAVFGILTEAFKQEEAEASEASSRDTWATGIYNELTKNYPILKTDKELEETFDTLLNGEVEKRKVQAEKLKAEGKELPGMEYADFEKLLLKIIGKKNQESKGKEDKPDETEKIHGGPNLNPGGSQMPKDEVDEAIEGMRRIKSQALF